MMIFVLVPERSCARTIALTIMTRANRTSYIEPCRAGFHETCCGQSPERSSLLPAPWTTPPHLRRRRSPGLQMPAHRGGTDDPPAMCGPAAADARALRRSAPTWAPALRLLSRHRAPGKPDSPSLPGCLTGREQPGLLRMRRLHGKRSPPSEGPLTGLHRNQIRTVRQCIGEDRTERLSSKSARTCRRSPIGIRPSHIGLSAPKASGFRLPRMISWASIFT